MYVAFDVSKVLRTTSNAPLKISYPRVYDLSHSICILCERGVFGLCIWVQSSDYNIWHATWSPLASHYSLQKCYTVLPMAHTILDANLVHTHMQHWKNVRSKNRAGTKTPGAIAYWPTDCRVRNKHITLTFRKLSIILHVSGLGSAWWNSFASSNSCLALFFDNHAENKPISAALRASTANESRSFWHFVFESMITSWSAFLYKKKPTKHVLVFERYHTWTFGIRLILLWL